MPDNCPDLKATGNIVTRLPDTVARNVNHKLFIDNFYTSLPLMAFLHGIGILPLGTIQLSSAKDINVNKKELQKSPRGHCVEKSTVIDGVQLNVTLWVDNKVVSLCSSYVGKEPMAPAKR